MKTLREKVKAGLSLEEKCDILWTLVNMVERNQNIGSDPDEIQIGDDGSVQVRHLGEGFNLALSAPEVVRAFLEGTPLPEIGGDQAWFTLGMLAYFLCKGQEYYIQKKLHVIDLPRWIGSKACVIETGDVDDIPFGRSISQMTAVNPSLRAQGIVDFAEYLTREQPGTAQIIYTCGGKTVGSERRTLRDDIVSLIPEGTVRFGEFCYRPLVQPVRIPYRPGVHSHTVELERAKDEAGPGRWLFVEKSVLTGQQEAGRERVRLMSLNKADSDATFQIRGIRGIALYICNVDESGRITPRSVIREKVPLEAFDMLQKYGGYVCLKYVALENTLVILFLDPDAIALAEPHRVELG